MVLNSKQKSFFFIENQQFTTVSVTLNEFVVQINSRYFKKGILVGSMATLLISFSYQPAVLQCFCCLSPSRKRGSRNNYTNLMPHCSLSPEQIEVEKRKYECPMGIRTHYKSLLSAWFLVNHPKLIGSIF